MANAWSHGTWVSATLTSPCTLGSMTRFSPLTSANTRSTARRSVFWKSIEIGSPVYSCPVSGCPDTRMAVRGAGASVVPLEPRNGRNRSVAKDAATGTTTGAPAGASTAARSTTAAISAIAAPAVVRGAVWTVDTSATTAGSVTPSAVSVSVSSSGNGRSPRSGDSSAASGATAPTAPVSCRIWGQTRAGTSPGTGRSSGLASPLTPTGPVKRARGASAVTSKGATTVVGADGAPPTASGAFDPAPVMGGPPDASSGTAASAVHAAAVSDAGSGPIRATGSIARSRGNTTRSIRSSLPRCSM